MGQFSSHLRVDPKLLKVAKERAIHATSQALLFNYHVLGGSKRDQSDRSSSTATTQVSSLVAIATTLVQTVKGLGYILDPAEFESEEFHHAGNSLVNLKVFAANRWKRVADMLETADGNRQILNMHSSMTWRRPWKIFQHFPIMHGPSRFGKSRSFLGEELDVECKGWDSIYGGRECLNVLRHLRTLPVVDEQYFEWHSILQAAFDAAEHGQMLMVADVGSGLDAMWLLRSAVAFHRLTQELPCVMLAVEINFALNGTEIFEDAVASNLPANRCTWMASPKVISTNSGLVELLDEHSKGKRWDLIDVDCDGCEVTLMSELVALALRVRRVHLSTHSREIHQLLLGFLKAASWQIDYHFAPRSAVTSLPSLGPFLTKDGRIVAASPFP